MGTEKFSASKHCFACTAEFGVSCIERSGKPGRLMTTADQGRVVQQFSTSVLECGIGDNPILVNEDGEVEVENGKDSEGDNYQDVWEDNHSISQDAVRLAFMLRLSGEISARELSAINDKPSSHSQLEMAELVFQKLVHRKNMENLNAQRADDMLGKESETRVFQCLSKMDSLFIPESIEKADHGSEADHHQIDLIAFLQPNLRQLVRAQKVHVQVKSSVSGMLKFVESSLEVVKPKRTELRHNLLGENWLIQCGQRTDEYLRAFTVGQLAGLIRYKSPDPAREEVLQREFWRRVDDQSLEAFSRLSSQDLLEEELTNIYAAYGFSANYLSTASRSTRRNYTSQYKSLNDPRLLTEAEQVTRRIFGYQQQFMQ